MRRRPRLNRPSVARPWVDLPASVTRLGWNNDDAEINLVCQDTGLVVYTTPAYGWGGFHSTNQALLRANRWMRRHGFKHNLVDHGFYTREVLC